MHINYQLFAVDLGLNPIEQVLIVFCIIAFFVMFGIASSKGDYQGLIKTTLANDQRNRDKKNKK